MPSPATPHIDLADLLRCHVGPDDPVETPLDRYAYLADRRRLFEEAIDELDGRMLDLILAINTGAEGYERLGYDRIAAELGVTKSYVQQLVNKAKARRSVDESSTARDAQRTT